MQTYLISYAAVRCIVPSLDFSYVYNNAEEVVHTGTLKLHILATIPAAYAICVRKHVQLQRKVHWRVYLRGRMVMAPLLVFESLARKVSQIDPTQHSCICSEVTLSCMESTFGKRLTLV